MLPKFKNKKFLDQALTHPSFSSFKNDCAFERLEFLGDRVLGIVIAEELYRRHPSENEGQLAKKFSKLVNKDTCKAVFIALHITENLKANPKELEVKTSHIFSDTCEAIIGALYLDQGLEKTRLFILENWEPYLSEKVIVDHDAKSRLQEWAQKKFKETPIYQHLQSTGSDHAPIFYVEVLLPNGVKKTGQGPTKKAAEKDAAFKIIQEFKIQ